MGICSGVNHMGSDSPPTDSLPCCSRESSFGIERWINNCLGKGERLVRNPEGFFVSKLDFIYLKDPLPEQQARVGWIPKDIPAEGLGGSLWDQVPLFVVCC